MITFQKDLLLTITNSHEQYLEKINNLLNNNSLILSDLSIDEAEKLIIYIKELNNNINILSNTINKILNIKKYNNLEKKIENELFLKIAPIITIYRSLLYEKYKVEVNNIDEQD
tara:strand:- start:5159 stop:5500 length:342 start_codon:yes stop_codon:yes gene_type:complete